MADEDDDDDEEVELMAQQAANARNREIHNEPLDDDRPLDQTIGERTKIINRFGFKVFNYVNNSDGNVVICPLNLISSLLILYIGSNGETFFELREYLNFEEFDDETVFKTIQDCLQLVSIERNKLQPNYHFLNRIRVLIKERAQTSNKFYIWTKRYFNAEVDKIDFERDGHMICDQINQSIQLDLDNKDINEIYAEINQKTELLLMSAVSFKNNWFLAFPLDNIIIDEFINDGITAVKVKMMGLPNWCWKMCHNMNWNSTIMEIPMIGRGLVFIVILPKRVKGMERLIRELSFESLEKTLKAVHEKQIDLYLPQFRLDCDYDFKEYFTVSEKLKVFTDGSEMAEISENSRIKPNHIFHKVLFQIDNEGYHQKYDSQKTDEDTRAIKVDHPFLFIVKDVRTGTYLFMGKVTRIPQII